jgi:hypothetical protein
VRLEGLGQLRNPVTSSGIKTRELPACSIVPQPSMLQHALKSDQVLGCRAVLIETLDLPTIGCYANNMFATVLPRERIHVSV